MDEHLETSWCTRCDRLIEPERITVHLDELNRPINILNSTTQSAQPTLGSPAVTRTRTLAPGLVRGTGRVQPNGALVSADTKARTRDQLPPVPPPSPVIARTGRASPPAPRRTRTIISQKQTPLYCSDKCRTRDADNLRLQSLGLARRESDSTASTSSVHSIFDARPATSASSLESYDVPARDSELARSKTLKSSTQEPKVEVDHTLRWSNGMTGLGAAPPKRLNNVRAPSPGPLDFLRPQSTRRGSATSARSAHSDVHTQAQNDAEERAARVAHANAYFAQHMPFPRAAERARLAEIDRARSASFLPRAARTSSSSSLKRVKSKNNSAPALTSIVEKRQSKYYGVSPTVLPEPKHPEPMIWSPTPSTDADREAFRNSWRRDGPPPLVVWSGHGYLTDNEVRQQCEVFGHPATFAPVEETATSGSPFHDPALPTVAALAGHIYGLRKSFDPRKADEAALVAAVLALPSYERADLLAPYTPPTREHNRDAAAMDRFVGRRMVRREVAGTGVVGGVDFGRGGYDKAVCMRSRNGALAMGRVQPSREEAELHDLLCEQWEAMRRIGLGWGCDERKRAAGEA